MWPTDEPSVTMPLSGMVEAEDCCTLLCVRADGVASVVDVAPTTVAAEVRLRALQLLHDHESCERVEVWRDGALLEEIGRT